MDSPARFPLCRKLLDKTPIASGVVHESDPRFIILLLVRSVPSLKDFLGCPRLIGVAFTLLRPGLSKECVEKSIIPSCHLQCFLSRFFFYFF